MAAIFMLAFRWQETSAPIPTNVDNTQQIGRATKVIGPVLEELAKEYQGKLHIYKVNTQQEGELSAPEIDHDKCIECGLCGDTCTTFGSHR